MSELKSTEKKRYSIERGGENEPALIMIVDHHEHVIVARSSMYALNRVEQLVMLANKGLEHVGR